MHPHPPTYLFFWFLFFSLVQEIKRKPDTQEASALSLTTTPALWFLFTFLVVLKQPVILLCWTSVGGGGLRLLHFKPLGTHKPTNVKVLFHYCNCKRFGKNLVLKHSTQIESFKSIIYSRHIVKDTTMHKNSTPDLHK